MEFHYAILDENNMVKAIISREGELLPSGNHVSLTFHDVSVFGKTYVNGEFI
jgi:hypothetical protein